MHSFCEILAEKYGVDECIFIQTLVLWTSCNAAHGEENNNHYQQGRYWSFGTPEYFCRYFRYWKPRRIKDIITSCLNQGLILKGVFNKKGYDRTNWYSLSDLTLLELNLDKTGLKPLSSLIRRNPSNGSDEIRPMDQTKSVQPIPNTKPNTKLKEKENIKRKSASGESRNFVYTDFDESEDFFEAVFSEPNLDNNQTKDNNQADKSLMGKEAPTRSDYCDTQPKECTESKKLKSFGLKDIKENNIFSIPEEMLEDWITTRTKKRSPVTQTAWNIILKELTKCKEQGLVPIECFETMVGRGWLSLEAKWIIPKEQLAKNEAAKKRSLELENQARFRKEQEIEDSKNFKNIISQVSEIERAKLRQLIGSRAPGDFHANRV